MRTRPAAEGSVRVAWALDVEPGDRAGVRWEVSTDLTPLPGREKPAEETPTRLARSVAVASRSSGTGASRGAGSAGDRRAAVAEEEYGSGRIAARGSGPTASSSTSRSAGASPTCACSGTTARCAASTTSRRAFPWFTTLFGRDSIITSLQVLPFMPDVARETLRILADWQATEDDPDRDMEPGKILHELRVGELARTGELPHRPYYGTIDATPLWLILLDETYRWTGDLDLVRSLWPNALAALAWIDKYGDRDGDGFVEYERRTPAGLLNQGWKDSGDAIRHRDGSLAVAPIALVEIQGYVYDAKLRMASLARRLGDAALAARLESEAADLLPPLQRGLLDAGHELLRDRPRSRQAPGRDDRLESRPLPVERDRPAGAGRRGRRPLLDPSMDCGWGIRTYASGQPGYNPVGYHTGTVWPHDNALIAAGMKRAGRHDAADRVASRIFEAAQHSPDFRLPELFCGFDRGLADMPVPYPVACSPQAWSAATSLSLLQTMLGMHADAARDVLELDRPHLPAWLGKVTVHELRVGERTVDLLFHRWRGNTTSAEVLRRDGPLELVIRV